MVNPDLLLILNKCGIDTGKIIYDLFEEILFSKTNNKHINFRQLYEITKIHFTVVGSCLTTKKRYTMIILTHQILKYQLQLEFLLVCLDFLCQLQLMIKNI
nr:patatin phospholipase [Mimivirus sp.]